MSNGKIPLNRTDTDVKPGGRDLKRVIIDTDPGVDDAAAIFLALASPELSVEALTTVYGNGPVEASTGNARRIIHAAGRADIPIYQGAGKPLLRPPNEGWASHVHGQDALGDCGYPLPPDGQPPVADGYAAVEIIRSVMGSPGEITFLALGRLTNLALALSIEPGLVEAIAEVVVMGGAVSVPGNVSPVASANLYEDPEAAAIVYSSGVPLAQVGLDVCNMVTISQRRLDRIAASDNPAARLLSGATPFLQRSYVRRGLLAESDGARYNNMPAVAYAVDPGLFAAENYFVEIETISPITRGQTVAHRPAPAGQRANARVCIEVDSARLIEMFTERVAGLPEG